MTDNVSKIKINIISYTYIFYFVLLRFSYIYYHLIVVVVTLFSNIIQEQNTSNTNLTNKAYPGYCKHVLCWTPPEKTSVYLAGGIIYHYHVYFTHRLRGDAVAISYVKFSDTICQTMYLSFPGKLPSAECRRTPLMIKWHWFMYWFGACGHQAINWSHVKQDARCHMESPGSNESTRVLSA